MIFANHRTSRIGHDSLSIKQIGLILKVTFKLDMTDMEQAD